MKKIIIFSLIAVMLVGILTACKLLPDKTISDGTSTTNTSTSTTESGKADGNKATAGKLSSIIDKIYEQKKPDFGVATVEVDINDADSLKYNTGLENKDNIKEVSISEPLIGSQAYSLVLVRVNSSADTEAIAKAMKDGIDKRKWICVEADDLRVAACDDVVMLCMVSTEFKDTITAEQMVTAFKTVCNSELSVDLK